MVKQGEIRVGVVVEGKQLLVSLYAEGGLCAMGKVPGVGTVIDEEWNDAAMAHALREVAARCEAAAASLAS